MFFRRKTRGSEPKTQIMQWIDEATDELHIEPNWETNMRICDWVSNEDNSAEFVMIAPF